MKSNSVITTYESKAHRIYTHGDGIIRIYSKPSHIDEEDVRSLIDTLKEVGEGKPMYLSLDPTEENSMTSEARKIVIKEFGDVCISLGVLARKKYVRMMGNMFKAIVNISFSFKLFDTEEEAIEWVKTQRDKNK